MKRYILEIKDSGELETCYWRGEDAEHAVERFWDFMSDYGAEGVEILSVKRFYTEEEKNLRKYNRNKVKLHETY